jgi:hypothetical protein
VPSSFSWAPRARIGRSPIWLYASRSRARTMLRCTSKLQAGAKDLVTSDAGLRGRCVPVLPFEMAGVDFVADLMGHYRAVDLTRSALRLSIVRRAALG